MPTFSDVARPACVYREYRGSRGGASVASAIYTSPPEPVDRTRNHRGTV